MHKFKRILVFLLIFAISAGLLTSCGGGKLCEICGTRKAVADSDLCAECKYCAICGTEGAMEGDIYCEACREAKEKLDALGSFEGFF